MFTRPAVEHETPKRSCAGRVCRTEKCVAAQCFFSLECLLIVTSGFAASCGALRSQQRVSIYSQLLLVFC